MWCSSMACRYRAGVALGARLEIVFLFASSGIVPNCPNRRNWGTLGAALVHVVYGRALVAWCGMLLYLNAASLTASSQCVLGSPLWCSAALAEFIRVPFILSAMPFCWGVCGTVVLCITLCERYMVFAKSDIYSLALSVCISWGLHPFRRLSAVRILSNRCGVSARDSKKSTMRYRDLLSITVSMYLCPWRDGGLNGPHMSLLKAAPTLIPMHRWVVRARLLIRGGTARAGDPWGLCRNVGGRLDKSPSFAIFCSVAGRM